MTPPRRCRGMSPPSCRRRTTRSTWSPAPPSRQNRATPGRRRASLPAPGGKAPSCRPCDRGPSRAGIARVDPIPPRHRTPHAHRRLFPSNPSSPCPARAGLPAVLHPPDPWFNHGLRCVLLLGSNVPAPPQRTSLRQMRLSAATCHEGQASDQGRWRPASTSDALCRGNPAWTPAKPRAVTKRILKSC